MKEHFISSKIDSMHTGKYPCSSYAIFSLKSVLYEVVINIFFYLFNKQISFGKPFKFTK